MKTNLDRVIETTQDARAFLKELHSNNEAYCPLSNSYAVIWVDVPTDQELDTLNILMGKSSRLANFDACKFVSSLK